MPSLQPTIANPPSRPLDEFPTFTIFPALVSSSDSPLLGNSYYRVFFLLAAEAGSQFR